MKLLLSRRNRFATTRASYRVILVATLATLSVVLISSLRTTAHSIDYLVSNISPAATFHGSSGNFTLDDPVAPNTPISFDVIFGIATNGQTASYPRTVTFGVGPGSSAGATLTPSACTFTDASSTCTSHVTVTAPPDPGNYMVKINPLTGVGGSVGLTGGTGFILHFVVAGPTQPGCTPASTILTVDQVCAILHQPSADLSATLTSGGSPVPGKLIVFTVDGNPAGSAMTDSNGVAKVVGFETSTLAVGDHTIEASFAGDCYYNGTAGSNVLGISYGQVRFQQPINSDGSSVFKSVKTIPVKILVTDYYGAPVTDAQAYVFFAKYSNSILGTEQEASPLAGTNADSGNLMRLADASIGQYILNWDTSTLPSATYRVRIELGEGTCGQSHVVDLSIKKK
jgi:Bacterial Ig-like domain (group 3)